MNKVSNDLDIKMNYTATDEHVPEAERNNRNIGERIRATYHNLPYKKIPKVMLQYLAIHSAQQLNIFPVKGGVSAYYSPHVIIKGESYDFAKHYHSEPMYRRTKSRIPRTPMPRVLLTQFICAL